MPPSGNFGSGFSKDCGLTEASAGLGGGAGHNDGLEVTGFIQGLFLSLSDSCSLAGQRQALRKHLD